MSDEFVASLSRTPSESSLNTTFDKDEECFRSALRELPLLTRMDREDEEQERFGPDSPDVQNGVAVTDEAVELQSPNFLTLL